MTEPRGRTGSAALTVLTTGASALARGHDLDQSLRELLGAAVDATGASRVALFAQDPDRAALELVIAFGLADDALAALATAAAQPEHPLAVATGARSAAFGRADPGEPGVTYVDIPLVVARSGIEEAVGVVSFAWSDDRPDDDETRRLLQATADLAAVAVDRSRLASTAAERSEWFERMAHSDPLTGLANARTIDRVLELEIARASRQGSEVSVAVFDVDDFVATNAEAGSRAGDDVLRQVAAVLADSVRLVDTVARYGGDEFLLVAPGSAGRTVARRVIDGIARLPEVAGRRISVSAGIARFPVDGTDGPSLIAAATAARQGAAAAGRGTIVEAAGTTGG
ncbi:MAG TPA: GGDEF domain-containing protein [Candidatus Limnocylindrales bacterium]|nr:GGDEF domain-containing protein [Candidatus Limnocylindrales bacterium]